MLLSCSLKFAMNPEEFTFGPIPEVDDLTLRVVNDACEHSTFNGITFSSSARHHINAHFSHFEKHVIKAAPVVEPTPHHHHHRLTNLTGLKLVSDTF